MPNIILSLIIHRMPHLVLLPLSLTKFNEYKR